MIIFRIITFLVILFLILLIMSAIYCGINLIFLHKIIELLKQDRDITEGNIKLLQEAECAQLNGIKVDESQIIAAVENRNKERDEILKKLYKLDTFYNKFIKNEFIDDTFEKIFSVSFSDWKE